MSKTPENKSQIIIYQTENGQTKIDVRFEGETVWLTQAQMAELFGKGRTTITEHIQNIFKEGELSESVVYREFRHTTQPAKHYRDDPFSSRENKLKRDKGQGTFTAGNCQGILDSSK